MKATIALCVCLAVLLGHAIGVVVNEDYLPTPGGYFHKSCIHEVPSGSTVHVGEDGSPTHAICPKGNRIEIPRCQYPSTLKNFKQLSLNQQTSSLVDGDGWQVYTYYHAGTKLDTYMANWNVPKNPPRAGGQILYTFNGLQNEYTPAPNADGTPAPPQIDIIQPVLQFGDTPAGGGNYWGVASWYVTTAAVHSKLVKVAENDTLMGTITMTKPGTWNILGNDTTTGASTDLNIDRGAITRLEPWSFVTLEVYDVTACNQYPTVPLQYTNIMLMANNQTETPTWKPMKQEQICKENVRVNSPSAVTITF